MRPTDVVRAALDEMLEARSEFIADDGPLESLDACADVAAVAHVRELFDGTYAETFDPTDGVLEVHIARARRHLTATDDPGEAPVDVLLGLFNALTGEALDHHYDEGEAPEPSSERERKAYREAPPLDNGEGGW